MKIRIHIILLLATLLAPLAVVAQTTVSTKIDAKEITIGDQVRYFIEVKGDKEGKLIWANIPDTFNTLEVIEKGKIDTVTKDGGITYKQRLLITGFDSGVYQIPAFEFAAVKGGNSTIFYTDSFDLYVQTIPVDTTKPFRDIKDIKEVELTWLDHLTTLFWIWRGLLLLTLVVMIAYTLLKKKKKPYIPPPSETLHERATRMLGELERKELWQKGEVKQYYVELTDILRYYIGGRYGITVLGLTTDELLDKMKTHKELTMHRGIIESALRIADMAKFAKAQPLPEEHIDAFNKISQFVSITVPIEETNPKEKKK
ncbi:MAG: hypothetical protein R2800_10610 [Flavipsychrobacter sp.]